MSPKQGVLPDRYMSLLPEMTRLKYGDPPGATAQLHERFRYVSPDLFYEATVAGLVGPDTDWLDVGCGRAPFPFNPAASRQLASRCRSLVGVDPSDNATCNGYVHRWVRGAVEALGSSPQQDQQRYDLVTLRMVAEHLESPLAAFRAIARVTRPGAALVVYTVTRLSPSVLLNRMLPRRLRNTVMRAYGGSDSDVFDTYYRANSRASLAALGAMSGFAPETIATIDDCRTSLGAPTAHAAELWLWAGIRRSGLVYPEACLLAVFRRSGPD